MLVFVFGMIYVPVLIYFAWKVPNPSSFAQWVFIIITALAGAGIGAMLPGALHYESNTIKAGGALAVFVIIVLNKPSLIESTAKFVPPPQSPVPIARAYLELTDQEKLEEAWQTLDSEARLTVASDLNLYKDSYLNAFKSIGKITDRVIVGSGEYMSPPGFPQGLYKVITMISRASTSCYNETVTLRANQQLTWSVFTHNVYMSPIPCPINKN